MSHHFDSPLHWMVRNEKQSTRIEFKVNASFKDREEHHFLIKKAVSYWIYQLMRYLKILKMISTSRHQQTNSNWSRKAENKILVVLFVLFICHPVYRQSFLLFNALNCFCYLSVRSQLLVIVCLRPGWRQTTVENRNMDAKYDLITHVDQ